MCPLCCVSMSSISIMVSWRLVEPVRSASPVSYSVRYKAHGDATWGPRRNAGTQLSAVLGGLQSNSHYDIEARADQGDLESEPSSASCRNTMAPSDYGQ